MIDFLKYWDTRIDANERIFNVNPNLANFAFYECQLLYEKMNEEMVDRQDTEKSLTKWVYDLGVELDTLKEAYEWERECVWLYIYVIAETNGHPYMWRGYVELDNELIAAQNEIEKLLEKKLMEHQNESDGRN